MKKYNIYGEGYMATCEHGKAILLGSASGNSFHEAILNFDFGKDKHLLKYDSKNSCFRFWGCRLFETLEEAQKSFG